VLNFTTYSKTDNWELTLPADVSFNYDVEEIIFTLTGGKIYAILKLQQNLEVSFDLKNKTYSVIYKSEEGLSAPTFDKYLKEIIKELRALAKYLRYI
jgi:hypothetical protein